MHPFAVSRAGWKLHVPVQVGVSGILAGDFTCALTAFTEAQLHPPLPAFSFLSRDALVKTALIHAAFGNVTTAKAHLERADQLPRTSSWIESQIDAHHDFASLLSEVDAQHQPLESLQSINLHDVGEMWPFYVLATSQLCQSFGQYDELEHRLNMLDAMSFPKVDGEGFSGSIIPLEKALLAMRSGRVAEAQELINRGRYAICLCSTRPGRAVSLCRAPETGHPRGPAAPRGNPRVQENRTAKIMHSCPSSSPDKRYKKCHRRLGICC